MGFTLNKDQEKLKEEIQGYIKGTKHTDKRYITVSGVAGGGKTTALKYALTKDTVKNLKVNGCAISNSASAILRKSLPNVDVETFTRTFNQQLTYDDEGNMHFETNSFDLNKIPAYKADVLIYDECSMVGPKQLNDVLLYTKPNTKIIFVGDIAQLSVIETGSISETFQNTVVDITEVMRAKPLLNDINNLFREEILSLINTGHIANNFILNEKIYFPDTTDGDIGYFNINNQDQFIDTFIKEYLKEPENPIASKIISYTNKNIAYYNKTIRERLFGYNRERYQSGDMLLTESPYINGEEYLPTNSYIKVNAVRKGQHKGVNVYFLDVETELQEFENVPVIDIDNDYFIYKIILGKLEAKARKREIQWEEVGQFKQSFCHVSYGYAINSHRAQGQTFKNSFVCETEIKKTKKPSDLNKLQSIYVATSRATDKIFMY